MTQHPLFKTARDLVVLGLIYTFIAQLLGGQPTWPGFAVVVACHAIYRSYRRQAAPAALPVASNVVPFPAAAK